MHEVLRHQNRDSNLHQLTKGVLDPIAHVLIGTRCLKKGRSVFHRQRCADCDSAYNDAAILPRAYGLLPWTQDSRRVGYGRRTYVERDGAETGGTPGRRVGSLQGQLADRFQDKERR